MKKTQKLTKRLKLTAFTILTGVIAICGTVQPAAAAQKKEDPDAQKKEIVANSNEKKGDSLFMQFVHMIFPDAQKKELPNSSGGGR